MTLRTMAILTAACRNALMRDLPYSVSPTTWWATELRCRRIWCCLPPSTSVARSREKPPSQYVRSLVKDVVAARCGAWSK
jgi:hypothetical protein